MKTMRKGMALLLSAAMSCSLLMAGTAFAEEAETESSSFVLEYTEDMQAQGYEALELESVPERVVCLSAAPVLALYELGVNIVGVVNSSVVTRPEDLTENAETISFSVMSDKIAG